MIPGYHDQEKFAHIHRQNLLKEAEHERRLAQVPQSDRGMLHHFLARPALFLRSLRTRLQEQAKRLKQITKRAAQ
jgi:molybdopterin-guanine dinucleotide biosynthesis protein A